MKPITREDLTTLTQVVHNKVKRWVKDGGTDIDPEDLCGACAIAATTLAEVLRARGHGATVVEYEFPTWGCHCWVETNGFVADPTSGQFTGFPPFYVVPKSKYDVVDGHSGGKTLKGKKAEVSINKWSNGQNPRKYRSKIRKLVASLVCKRDVV